MMNVNYRCIDTDMVCYRNDCAYLLVASVLSSLHVGSYWCRGNSNSRHKSDQQNKKSRFFVMFDSVGDSKEERSIHSAVVMIGIYTVGKLSTSAQGDELYV